VAITDGRHASVTVERPAWQLTDYDGNYDEPWRLQRIWP
jgi:hypothetical protein